MHNHQYCHFLQLESPKVVHVYHEYRQPIGDNVCSSHKCSHLCVRSPQGEPLCVCPDGMILSTGNFITCIYDGKSHIISTVAYKMV